MHLLTGRQGKNRLESWRRGLLGLFFCLWIMGLGAPAHAVETAGRKLALVIGNSAYAPVVALKNPGRDADLIAASLGRLGFSVSLLKDRNQQQMNQDVDDFARQARDADVVLVYYAGHGLEVDGQNFLIPVDQFPNQLATADLKRAGLSISAVQTALNRAQVRVTVLVMDACRSLPGRGNTGQGFAETRPARGMLQLFSTAPGKPAADGTGNNSPFALAFNRHLQNTQLSLKEVVELTQAEVDQVTQGGQRPWVVSGLAGDLRLANPGAAEAGRRQRDAAPATTALQSAPLQTASLRRGGGPPESPFLRLDAGTHLGPIWALDSDASGHWLATAGDDKTVRVWELPEGRWHSTLRPPLGDGPEARLLAVAISPDGELVATGGATGLSWDGTASIYLFDRRTGQMRIRLPGLPGLVAQLAFSPDGRRLAAGVTGRQFQVRVYDLGSGTEPQILSAEATAGQPVVSTTVAWAADGRMAAMGNDGQLYSFATDPSSGRINPRPLATMRLPNTSSAPKSLSFSPDGRTLAVAYSPLLAAPVASGPGPVVELRDSVTLQPRLALDTQGLNNRFPADTPTMDLGSVAQLAGLDRVAWSADGQQLLGVGQWNVDGRTQARVWATGSGQVVRNVATGRSTALSVRSSPRGGWWLAFGDGAWGQLDAGGRWQTLATSPVADLRGSCCQGALRLEPSAQAVQFGLSAWGRQPQVFDLRRRELRAGTLAQGLLPLQNQLGVQDWMNSAAPQLNGQRLTVNTGGRPHPLDEPIQSLAELPDRSGFVLGSQVALHRFDHRGAVLWSVPLPAIAWGLNIDRSARLLVAALGDGSLRWYRLSDGQELLALFVQSDGKRWLLWTPTGYFDASPGGESLAGWHLNRGAGESADFFPLQQFRDRFYRPDVINQVLLTLDEEQAVVQANAQAQRQEARTRVDQFLPPVLEAVDTPTGFAEPTVALRLRVRSPSDAPLRRLRLWVNGAVPAASDWQQHSGPDGELHLSLKLPPRNSTLRVLADNRHGSSLPLQLNLRWEGAAGSVPTQAATTPTVTAPRSNAQAGPLPRLWLLAVGVSSFADPAMPTLRFAHLDATAFADTLRQQSGRAYREVQARVLTNAQADRASILAGLQWLQAQMAEGDVGMVFLAGHGFTLGADHRYYFGSHDARLEQLPDTGVPYKAIQDTLVALNLRGGGSRSVFFIDTCHAGQAPLNARGSAVRLSNGEAMATELSRPESQVLVFASSRADQLSWEYPQAGHGAYTQALLEGLGSPWKADPYGLGQVTYKGLDAWVSARVPGLTQGQQTPRLITPAGGLDDFPLARR